MRQKHTQYTHRCRRHYSSVRAVQTVELTYRTTTVNTTNCAVCNCTACNCTLSKEQYVATVQSSRAQRTNTNCTRWDVEIELLVCRPVALLSALEWPVPIVCLCLAVCVLSTAINSQCKRRVGHKSSPLQGLSASS